MLNYDNRYRKWKKEIKEYRRKKFPFLNGFFKELRIREILSEFNNDVRVLELFDDFHRNLKPNLDNLDLNEIYEFSYKQYRM